MAGGSTNRGKGVLAAGLDAGGAWTRCVILALEDEQLRFLGYGEAESRGWVRGRISDPALVSESIQYAVRAAERMARVSIESVVAGVGGATVQGFVNRGVYEFFRPQHVRAEEMAYAVQLGTQLQLGSDRFVLQMLPMDFTLDGRAGIRKPVGAVCSRLEANVYVITCSEHEHQALVAAIHQAHLAVEETVFEPMAAAYAAILPEDRARGAALIDIGAQGTNLVAFEGEMLLHAAGIAIGGDHFTRDVSQVLKVNFEDAEQLKVEYGCAIVGLASDSSFIELPSAEGRPPREEKRRRLNEILEARAEELFFHARNELARAGMAQALAEGVVLSGGGSLLNGMCDVAEAVLNCPARNGLVIGVEDWPEEIDGRLWTTAAGLAMYSARLKLHREPKRKVPSLAGLIMK